PIYERAAKMEAAFDRFSATPRPVVRAIARAIHARRPRARYVAPRRFIVLIAVVRMLPTSWADALMRRAFGLTRANLPTPPVETGAAAKVDVKPPSTTTSEPVVKLDASDNRYTAAPAISAGCAWRPIGVRLTM